MKNKFKVISLILFLSIILIFNAQGSNLKEVIWEKKIEIKPHYIFQINAKIYCWEIGKGYVELNEKGKIIKTEMFSENDERKNIAYIKIIPFTGVFGILYYNRKTLDMNGFKVNEEWIIEIEEGLKYEKIKMNQNNEEDTEYLISKDKKSYLFLPFGDLGAAPEEFVYAQWKDIKNSKSIKMLKETDLHRQGKARIYYLNNKYYQFRGLYLYIYNDNGKKNKSINFEENLLNIKENWRSEKSKGENFYKNIEIRKTLENGLYKSLNLNDFIYSDDGYFYLTPININDNKESYKYYILKIDKDLNLIGKRKVELNIRFKDRCIAGVYADKSGFVYIISDMEKSITKFTPIEKDENSVIEVK